MFVVRRESIFKTTLRILVMRVTLALTGASGIAYGMRLAEALKGAGAKLDIVVTAAALKVMDYEEPGGSKKALARLEKCGRVYGDCEIGAPPASGSSGADAVVVCPCSMKTLSAIACGFSFNLVARAADVAIKEGKTLVLVVRETPISAIHLENMLKLARLGVVIMPASPALYHSPKKVEDQVDFIAGKVLDRLKIKHSLYRRWKP